MNEILFRGKSKLTGSWVFGDLITKPVHHECCILENGCINHSVYPESVGQYTGLNDKNDIKIFKKDILKTETKKLMIVGWSKKFASFIIQREDWFFTHWFGEGLNPKNCEVVGNMIDTPELIS